MGLLAVASGSSKVWMEDQRRLLVDSGLMSSGSLEARPRYKAADCILTSEQLNSSRKVGG